MTIHTGLYFICNHCTYAIPIYCLICCFIAYVLFLCDKYVLLDILLVNKIYIYINQFYAGWHNILVKPYGSHVLCCRLLPDHIIILSIINIIYIYINFIDK